MATPSEKLAESLQVLKELQDKDNSLVIYGTTQLSRTHLGRLKLNGWLQEVMNGWSSQRLRGRSICLPWNQPVSRVISCRLQGSSFQ